MSEQTLQNGEQTKEEASEHLKKVEEQPSSFETFASAAIRGPRKGIYQHLVCQHLISAVSASSLKKIRLICEAAMMLEDPKSADIDIEEIDMLHRNTLGFLLTTHYTWGKSHYFCYMAWPFQDTEENYERYIAPWRTPNTSIRYYPVLMICYSQNDVEEQEEAMKEIEKAVAKMASWQQFLWITRQGKLTELSYTNLVSQFVAWALPKVQKIFPKIAKQVNPSLYYEILQSMTQREEVGKPKLAQEATQ